MSVERTTTLNIIGKVEIATQKGTEEVDLGELLKEEITTIIVKGDDVDAQIILTPLSLSFGKVVHCRIGLIIRERLGGIGT